MALFSLSPLLLSAIATNFFIHPATGQLNICHFMSFLALLTGFVHILGFINMQGLKQTIDQAQITSEAIEGNISQETSPLLASASQSRLTMQASNPSTVELLRRIDFWLLAIFCLLIVGAVRISFVNFSPVLSFEYFLIVRDGDIEYWYNHNGSSPIINWTALGAVNRWISCRRSSQNPVNFQHRFADCFWTSSRFRFASGSSLKENENQSICFSIRFGKPTVFNLLVDGS